MTVILNHGTFVRDLSLKYVEEEIMVSMIWLVNCMAVSPHIAIYYRYPSFRHLEDTLVIYRDATFLIDAMTKESEEHPNFEHLTIDEPNLLTGEELVGFEKEQ